MLLLKRELVKPILCNYTISLTNDELEEISRLQKEYENLINERTFKNKKDLDFFKKML